MVVKVVQTFDSDISAIVSLIDADTSFFFITEDSDGFITGNLELGVSDGTTEGTLILGEGGDGESYVGLNGQLFYDGFSSESGEEPFIHDGTVDGNKLLKDINPTPNETSDPLNFTRVEDTIYFTANDGANGVALWSSDGTPDGTF